MPVNVKPTVRRSPKSALGRGTDWRRVDRLSDRRIAKAVAEDADAAPLLDDAWFKNATVVRPERKVPVSMRLDRAVLDWFKAQGPGYQSRINALLKAYVAAQVGKG